MLVPVAHHAVVAALSRSRSFANQPAQRRRGRDGRFISASLLNVVIVTFFDFCACDGWGDLKA